MTLGDLIEGRRMAGKTGNRSSKEGAAFKVMDEIGGGAAKAKSRSELAAQ